MSPSPALASRFPPASAAATGVRAGSATVATRLVVDQAGPASLSRYPKKIDASAA